MDPTPKITVVTVCYNAAAAIEETMLSVINQTYPNIKYIIIDGASTDNTMEIVNKYRDRISVVVSEPDKGIYDAMNKGIKLATGQWINFMNAGDVYHDYSVLSNFAKDIDSTSTIVYGDTQMVYKFGKRIWKPFPLEQMKKRMCFGHPATFVRTSYHKEHLFDTSYRSSGDYKMLFDAYYKDQVKFQYLPLVVADFEAEGGISSNRLLQAREDARLKGIENTLGWKINFCWIYLAQFIKKFIPNRILEQRKLRMIHQENF